MLEDRYEPVTTSCVNHTLYNCELQSFPDSAPVQASKGRYPNYALRAVLSKCSAAKFAIVCVFYSSAQVLRAFPGYEYHSIQEDVFQLLKTCIDRMA
jgi:hypothetical protein